VTRLIAILCGLVALIGGEDAQATTLRVGKGGAYATVQAAVNALPADGGTLELAPGEYREKLDISKPNVRLIGKGKRPQDVVLVWSDGAMTAGGTFKSASVNVSGDGFRARNLTIQNDYHLKDPARPRPWPWRSPPTARCWKRSACWALRTRSTPPARRASPAGSTSRIATSRATSTSSSATPRPSSTAATSTASPTRR
jgi:hypothetical protein